MRPYAWVSNNSFSGPHAADIAGISYRQLDYWARTNLLGPSVVCGHGSGFYRGYTRDDIVHLRLIKRLLDGGLHLAVVRRVFDYLRTVDTLEINDSILVIKEDDIVLCPPGDLSSRLQTGHLVQVIYPTEVAAEVDALIRAA